MADDVTVLPDMEVIGTPTAPPTEQVAPVSDARPDKDYRVVLRNSTNRAERVVFAATPDVIETRNVNYKTVEPVHAPGAIYAFATSSSRTFNLSSVKLISRTPAEAAANLLRLWTLRGWTMPDFGGLAGADASSATAAAGEAGGLDMPTLETAGLGGNILGMGSAKIGGKVGQAGTAAAGAIGAATDTANAVGGAVNQAQQLGGMLGMGGDNGTAANAVMGGTGSTRGQPPAVLLLSAYSRDSSAGPTPGGRNVLGEHINQVPVVIQTISFPYPSDVDYIPAEGSGVPMPMIMSIDMTLVETHSPREYEQFSLSAYKAGILAGF